MSNKKAQVKHCEYNNFKRARYFHGMLMTDRDFREEQIYHNEKRKLLNRTLHGWGVVCGLEVKPTDPAGPNIIVEPGMALDCHGNEIMLCEKQTVDLAEKFCQSTKAKYEEDICAEYRQIKREPATLYVVIKYHENPTDPVPVYAPGGDCEEKACDYSRTREGFCIEVWDHPPDSPPLKAIDSGEACTEPHPCPSCCPDPHYILLATISCGPRFDGLFGTRLKKQDPDIGEVEIRYWVERTLDKVCIRKGATRTEPDMILVRGSYEFDPEDHIDYSSINWNIEEVGLDGLCVEIMSTHQEDRKFVVEFKASATAEAATGLAHIEVPVSVEYKQYKGDQETTIRWERDELPALQSPIEIGTSDVQRSNISLAMIRNVQQRKFVATFPWFAWLSEVMGEEDVPWSGDVSEHCAPVVEGICAARREVSTGREVSRRLEKVKKDLSKEMLAKVEKVEKKSADAIKKVEKDYNQKLVKMNKTIKELEEKVKEKG